MNRLLLSGFCRMIKSKLMWGISALSAIYGIFSSITIYQFSKINGGGDYYTLDIQFFSQLVFLGIATAVFASIFIGTDYSDGTIRNKIAAGHTRLTIYLSNLILVFAAALVFLVSYWLLMLVTGVMLSLWFSSSAAFIFGQILMCLGIAAAYSAIFVFVSMLSQSRANSAVICMVTAFVLLFSSAYISGALKQPELVESWYYDEAEEDWVTDGTMLPNPSYPKGIKRELLEFADEVLPSSQAGNVSGMYGDSIGFDWRLLLYSVGFTAVFTAGGALLFKRKDLK